MKKISRKEAIQMGRDILRKVPRKQLKKDMPMIFEVLVQNPIRKMFKGLAVRSDCKSSDASRE